MADPTELRITFTGLCLFSGNGMEMNVLLPNTSGHGAAHGSVEHHSARLLFDSAHTRAGSTQTDKMVVHIGLEELVLEVAFSDTINLTIPPKIINLFDVTGEKLDSNLLSKDTAKLTSRVKLSAGKVETFEDGACWHFLKKNEIPMPHRLTWLIPKIPAGPVKLTLTRIDGKEAPVEIKLHPISAGAGSPGIINLQIFHCLAAEIPPNPAKPLEPVVDDPARHFAAYYPLLGKPYPTMLPRYRGKAGCGGTFVTDGGKGGSPFNCMFASGTF